MAANTESQIKTLLAAVLKQDEADLPAYYDTHLPAALNAAYYDVLGALLRRGFTQAEALSFDSFAQYEADIAVYWCLIRTGAYQGMDPQTVRALDRRAELADVLVFNAGVWIQPPSGRAGTASSSGPVAGGYGAFTWDDSQPNLGFDW